MSKSLSNSMRDFSTDALDAVIAFSVGLCIFFVGFGQPLASLLGPLGVHDLIFYYGVVNSSGLPGEISPHIGYPFGFDLSFFPGTDVVQIALARAISSWTGTVYFGVNAVYVLSFGLASLFAWFACRLAYVPRILALPIGLAYTALPTHWFRVEHLWLATMWSLPVAVSIALIALGGRMDSAHQTQRSRTAWVAVASVLALFLAWSGLYYTVFGLAVICLAVVFRFTKAPSLRQWLWNLVPVAVILVGTAAALVGGLLARRSVGGSVGYLRSPTESLMYAGQLSDAILPNVSSTFPLIGRLGDVLVDSNAWADSVNAIGMRWTANQGTALTLAGAIALFCWVALWGGRDSTERQRRPPITRKTWRKMDPVRHVLVFLAATTTLTVITFVPYGLGSLFANMVTAEIRAWERMIVLFQLLLLLAFGCVASLALVRIRDPRRRVLGGILVAAFIVSSTIMDGALPGRDHFAAVVPIGDSRVTANAAAADRVNSLIGSDCAVLQLPYMTFPEGGTYEPLWLAFEGRRNMWSFGGVSGSKQDEWLRRIAADIPNNLKELRERGFCGVVLDSRVRIPSGQPGLEAPLTSALGQPYRFPIQDDLMILIYPL